MKHFPKQTLIVLITSLTAFLYGCIKDEDFDLTNMAANQWNPDLAVPLIHSSMSINDITGMNESGLFTVNNQHQISLIYKTNIYTQHGYQFFTPVNESNFQTLQIFSPDSITLYQTNTVSRSIAPTMTLTFPNNEQIDSMNFRTGILRINLYSGIPHDAVLNIKIPTASKAGVVFDKNIPIAAAAGSDVYVQQQFDMAGYNMGTKKNNMPNQLDLVYTLTFNNSGTTLPTINKVFNITSTFDAITPSSLFGYFGQREFLMPNDSINIGVFNNFSNGSIYFDDPKVTITLTNSFGMPLDAQIKTFSSVQNNGTVIPVTGPYPSPMIDYPLTFGQTSTTSFTFDKNNSNIQQIINSAPNNFIYNISAATNSPLPTYNFMSDSSVFKADLKLELPLKGYAVGFTIQDTIDFALSKIEQLSSASFRLNISNGFPVSAYAQIYFVDDNYNIIDSLLSTSQNRLFEAAEVDNNGTVTVPTVRSSDESFEGARLQNLFTAKKIMIRATIQTRDAPTSMVEILDNYKLDFKIGVRTKLNLQF